MQHSFTHDKKRYMYDLSSGYVFEYTRLEKELLPFLKRMGSPLPVSCPMALRYSLAKYEVSEINSAYMRLRSLAEEKKLVFNKTEVPELCAKMNADEVDFDLAVIAFSQAVNNIPNIESLLIFPKGEKAEALTAEIKSRFSFIEVITE